MVLWGMMPTEVSVGATWRLVRTGIPVDRGTQRVGILFPQYTHMYSFLAKFNMHTFF